MEHVGVADQQEESIDVEVHQLVHQLHRKGTQLNWIMDGAQKTVRVHSNHQGPWSTNKPPLYVRSIIPLNLVFKEFANP